MATFKTHEDFVKFVLEKYPSYEILSKYKGVRQDIVRRCKICGDTRTVKARALIEGHRGCLTCIARARGREKAKAHEQFVKEMKSVNPNIEILSNYVANNQKVKCKCLIDGYEWGGIPHTLLQGHGCPECYRRKANRRNEEEFLAEMKEKHPTIEVLSKYVRTAVKVKFKCTVCGYEWEAIPDTLINNKNPGCPKCSHHAPVTEEEYAARVRENNKRVEYLNGYKGMEYHANFRCKICGYEWHTIAVSILRGRCCPRCNMSQGENALADYFDLHGIYYIRQYKFEDCKNERELPFDFYLPDYNEVWEVQGIQHYKPIEHFGGEERFKYRKHNDEIKANYCKEKGIALIEIPYTDFDNIETILDKHFSQILRKRIFGIAGKIGQLDQRGTVHTYQDYDNNAERVHIMLKDYQYTYVISDIDRVAKITFSA